MGFGGCALLLAEEKDNEPIEAGKSDLERKFQWIPHFHKLPFVFGIAINRIYFEVFAMAPTSELRTLFRSPLSTPEDKWDCVIASINIARVLRHFIASQSFIPVTLDLNTWVDRGHGKRIRIGMIFVEVCYSESNTFQRLSSFYTLTAERRIPNMERLYIGGVGVGLDTDNVATSGISHRRRMIRLVPVGIARKPESVSELRTVLGQIIKCVAALHSLGYCHCDIRWSNIVWAKEEWYLIDCTFATSLGDIARLERMSATLKDRYVLDRAQPWSPRHDWFQIGQLIRDSQFGGSCPRMSSLCEYLCDRSLVTVEVDLALGMCVGLAADPVISE
jgi:hypothetical protein